MIKLKTLLEDADQNNNGYPDSTEGSSNNVLHINLRAVYAILKANNLGPKITDGNRITGIKSIDFGSYDEKTGEDGGRLSIDSTGELYGQDNWGMTIKDANEVMDAVDQYRKDQKEQGYPDSTEGSTNNEFTDYQYESLVSWYYIENTSNYPGTKGRTIPYADEYNDPSKYEGTELYIPKGTKGYKEAAGSTPYFTDYEGNSVPFIKKYFKLNPNMTNETLRMQMLAGIITEG